VLNFSGPSFGPNSGAYWRLRSSVAEVKADHLILDAPERDLTRLASLLVRFMCQ